MKILINTSSTFKGGGIQVAKSFIEECRKINQNEYAVVLSEPLSKAIDISSFPKYFTFHVAPFRPATKVFKFLSHNYFLKKIEESWNPDVVFTTSGPSYWRPKSPHLMGYNLPHYVYPESPYFKKISIQKILWWTGMKIFAKYVFKRDADVLVVQTQDVNDRVRKFLNKTSVHTVYNTINTCYENPKKVEKKLPKKTPDEFRFLTLSAWYPHKNLSIIPQLCKILKYKGFNNLKFVVTLPDSDFKKLNLTDGVDNIINVGIIKVEEAPSLYNECDAMFLPTLLECFSASYVEAMKMRKPIVTSDMGFAHTICQNAAIYVNPIVAKDIATKIIDLYNSKVLQNRLIENGLSRIKIFGTASQRATHYLEICEKLINEK